MPLFGIVQRTLQAVVLKAIRDQNPMHGLSHTMINTIVHTLLPLCTPPQQPNTFLISNPFHRCLTPTILLDPLDRITGGRARKARRCRYKRLRIFHAGMFTPVTSVRDVQEGLPSVGGSWRWIFRTFEFHISNCVIIFTKKSHKFTILFIHIKKTTEIKHIYYLYNVKVQNTKNIG